MTQPDPVKALARTFTTAQVEHLVRQRTEALRGELEEEMRARAVAETEADFRAEHVAELRGRLATLEEANRRLLRILWAKVWRKAWPFALGGLASGFAAVALMRWAGW